MNLTPYVESLRHDLSAAAEAGGPDARAAAERLALALDPAMRMALMDALSQAAAEITSELPTGSVDVRLRGREPQFVVDLPSRPAYPAPTSPLGSTTPSAARDDAADVTDDTRDDAADDDAVARITLRMPESLKYRAEELAAKGGHSLNGWIVNVIRAATRERAIQVDLDLSSVPFLDGANVTLGRGPGGRRMTGWV